MRRLYSFFLGIILIILLLWGITSHLEANNQQGTTDKLVIYNWGDYIDPDLSRVEPPMTWQYHLSI